MDCRGKGRPGEPPIHLPLSLSPEGGSLQGPPPSTIPCEGDQGVMGCMVSCPPSPTQKG